MEKDKGEIKDKMKKIMFALLPLIVLLVLGEIVCTFYMYYRYEISPTFMKPVPVREEMIFDIDKNFEGYYKMAQIGSCYLINSLGFRGEEFSPYQKEKIRIFCLGGSSVFGPDISDNQTWPFRLGVYLGKDYEVINAGFPGADIGHSLMIVKKELINYKPDVFIFYSGFNDISFNDISPMCQKGVLHRIHRVLYYRSMLYTYLVEKINILLHQSALPQATMKMRAIDYESNVKKVITLCKEENIKPVFVRQILAIRSDKDALLKEHNRIMEFLKQICKENGVKFISPEIAKDYFYSWVHLKPEGNDILAKAIYNQYDTSQPKPDNAEASEVTTTTSLITSLRKFGIRLVDKYWFLGIMAIVGLLIIAGATLLIEKEGLPDE